MSKYKLAKETLWIARKPGCFTGYGETPKKAFANAEKRESKRYADIKQLEEIKKFYLSKVEKITNSQNEQLREYANLAMKSEADRLEGVVMMAMVHFKLDDPADAVKRARMCGLPLAGVTKEVELAVRGYMMNWLGIGPAKLNTESPSERGG